MSKIKLERHCAEFLQTMTPKGEAAKKPEIVSVYAEYRRETIRHWRQVYGVDFVSRVRALMPKTEGRK